MYIVYILIRRNILRRRLMAREVTFPELQLQVTSVDEQMTLEKNKYYTQFIVFLSYQVSYNSLISSVLAFVPQPLSQHLFPIVIRCISLSHWSCGQYKRNGQLYGPTMQCLSTQIHVCLINLGSWLQREDSSPH